MAKTKTKSEGGLTSKVQSLKGLFDTGIENAKSDDTNVSKSAGKNLMEVMQQYSEFAGSLRVNVNNTKRASEKLGLNIKSIYNASIWEKGLNYLPIFGERISNKIYISRLKKRSLAENMTSLMNGVELYSQTLEAMCNDLEQEKVKTIKLRDDLLGRAETAAEEIETYKVDLNSKVKEMQKVEAQKAGKSKADQMRIDGELDKLIVEKDNLESQLSQYVFRQKCATDNYEYSQVVYENLKTLIRSIKQEGVFLQSLAKDARDNMQSLTKILTAVQAAANGVSVYRSVQSAMNEGARLAGFANQALSTELSSMLSEDLYDPKVLAESVKNAKNAMKDMNEAVEKAYQKLDKNKGAKKDKA
ncbi:MAG: hypothetical protein ABIB71_05480 [Candidatus Woesearchaeota archaeon]